MTDLEILIEFSKFYDPEFHKNRKGYLTWCLNKKCDTCKVMVPCFERDDAAMPKIYPDEFDKVKELFPEHFI